jgi:hypothetical protein
MTEGPALQLYVVFIFLQSLHTKRKDMNDISEEERKRILQSSPVGTWALMLIVGGGMAIAWLLMYYGVFLPRGYIG